MNRKLFIAGYAMIGLLLFPAFYYSVLTPFALIDDLENWRAISIFNSPMEWIDDILFSIDTRFRPTWELNNALMWSILGDNPYLHHFIRFSLKLIPLFFFYKTLKILLNNQDSIKLIILSFAVLYLFTPNAPDARLAPQETLLILFFSISLYLSVKIQQNSFALNTDYFFLLLAFLLLAGSKETALPLLLATILFLAFIGRRTYKTMLLLLPFLVIFLLLFYQAYSITQVAGYGTKSISTQLIYINLIHVYTYVFMKGWAFLLIGPVLWSGFKSVHTFLVRNNITFHKNKIKLISHDTYSSVELFIILVFLCFLGFSLLAMIFWIPSLRYFYPLSFLWAIIFSFSLNYIWTIYNRKSNTYILVVIASLCLFIYSNYHNFLQQYITQYETRTNEKQLLISIKQHLDKNGEIVFMRKSEYEGNMIIYFNSYLHHFNSEQNYNLSHVGKEGSKVLYLSRKKLNQKQFEVVETFKPISPKIIKFIRHVSPPQIIWHDYGAGGAFPWYLSRRIKN